MGVKIKNFINSEFVDSRAEKFVDVVNPATLEHLGKTPLGTALDVDEVVDSAATAFVNWSVLPIVDRLQPLFRLKNLLEESVDEISNLIVQEHGKTFKEAQGDIRRGIQMVESACGMANLGMGEWQSTIARDINSYAERRPLGVFVAITPFNFPAMVPFWFWPFAVAAGNSFIVKPSEVVPLAQMRIFALIKEAGFPPGVINMVHGGKEVVNALITHPKVAGISFVGSTAIAKYVWATGIGAGKRVQALGGAKNSLVLMPDAAMERSVAAMVDSCYGCAGERCLAGSIMIGVGDAYNKMRELVVSEVNKIKTGNGMDKESTMGPVISVKAKDNILNDIEVAVNEGAELIVDGRNPEVGGLPGHFIGPTVFDKVPNDSILLTKEIFGPVVALVSADTLDDAIKFINSSPYGNTTSIFTSSGGVARYFTSKVDPSMVGINIGVPAPMSFFSFGGSKDSFFGDIKAHGTSAIEFFTEKLMVMERWFEKSESDAASPHWSK